MSEFGPAQLDALEDALEDLEVGVPPEAGVAGGPEVAQRLEEYREILQWTRDAMPLTEVTPGLLDGVLAEARSVAPTVEPGREVQATATSWWKKLRGVFLLPALAVAGSAALVLLLVRPAAETEHESTFAASADEPGSPPAVDNARSRTAAAESPADGKPAGMLENGLADASVDEELSRGRLRLPDDGAASQRGEAAQEPAVELEEAEEAPKQPAAPAPEPPAPPKPSPARKGRASERVPYDDDVGGAKSKSGGAGGPPGAPSGSSPPAAKNEEQKRETGKDADDPWGAMAAADKLRRAGNCASARSRYKALVGSSDRRVRARALAGLGLCEAAAGNDGAANDFFGKAKKADPDIAGFIAHERSPQADAAEADALEDSL
jgi:hypothetical protein